MSNPEHVKLLHAGPAAVNEYRAENGSPLDLRGAELSGLRLLTTAFLHDADFSGARLRDVHFDNVHCANCRFDGAIVEGLFRGYFADATFRGATLRVDGTSSVFWQANFSDATVSGCNFAWSNLRRAKFDDAKVRHVIFQNAELPLASFRNADVTGVDLMDTVLTGVDLSGAIGLDDVRFQGPVAIDHDTIRRSGELPRSFLRGCGVPDELIDFYEATTGAIKFYSAFISHSSPDKEFAHLIWRDLQDAGIRCWLAPKALSIGDKIRPAIGEAIRVHDKLLVILSKDSMQSSWVEAEVEAALERERKESRAVLFPITLDDALSDTTTEWAAHIRQTRHVGDFRDWRDETQYASAFERLRRDLRRSD